MHRRDKGGIKLKSPDEVERMRASGRLVRKVLNLMHEMCKPGVTTLEMDEAAYETYTAAGATGLFKGYPEYIEGKGFPANTCISVNEEVVHGIAGDRVIQDGDIVGVDCGVLLDGWCGDAATTILVGNVKPDVKKLCEATQHVLNIAIENIKPGRKWSQVARLMQNYAERSGYGVVRDFVGHGVGTQLHEDPKVPNYVDKRDSNWKEFTLRPGMVIAVEPMCTLGTAQTEVLADNWTVVTLDRKASAHYEHTIAVTEDGADVLTDGR